MALRSTSPLLTAAAVLALAIATSGPIAAQMGADLCDLLPPEVTTPVLGSDEPPAGDSTSCMWLSETALVLVELVANGYEAERASRPGGEDVEVAGIAAYRFGPDSPDVDASLVLVPFDQQALLLTVMSITDPGVDVVPVSLRLAEAALTGIAGAAAEATRGASEPEASSDVATAQAAVDPCGLLGQDVIDIVLGPDVAPSTDGETSCIWWDDPISIGVSVGDLETLLAASSGWEEIEVAGTPAHRSSRDGSVVIPLGQQAFMVWALSMDPEFDAAALTLQLAETALTGDASHLPARVDPVAETSAAVSAWCETLAAEEVSAVVGIEVEPSLHWPFQGSCGWEGTEVDGSIDVNQMGADFTAVFASDSGGAWVDGLGDEAWWIGEFGRLSVFAGDLSFDVRIDADEPDDVARTWAIAVAEGFLAHASAMEAAPASIPPSPVPLPASSEPGSGSTDALFPTPEGAVREYMIGLADADLSRILHTVAIDEIAEGVRFDLQVERLKAFLPYEGMAPPEHPFFVEMNRMERAGQVMRQLRYLVYGLLSEETIDGGVIGPVDLAWAEDFVALVDPERLAGLALLDIGIADREMLESDVARTRDAERAAVYGADELTERVALFSFDDELYYVGFTLGRFGDEWKVISQVAPLAGMSSLGTAVPTTMEAYEELTGAPE